MLKLWRRLLLCRGFYVAFGCMENQLGIFWQGAFKWEINFYDLHPFILKLEIALKVDSVDIGGFDEFGTHDQVYSIDAL